MAKQTDTRATLDPDDFIGRLYFRLVGATVLAFKWEGDFPVFTVRLKDGTERTISIAQDAEINGPGFIEGLED